jgi:hypothetical protein
MTNSYHGGNPPSCNRDFLILFYDATMQTGINKIELPIFNLNI